MNNHVIRAEFGQLKSARTRALYQWDYGIQLEFDGLNLPDVYAVHFANQLLAGEAKTWLGGPDGVLIPNEFLTSGNTIYAWIFLHEGIDDGESVYTITIPVNRRPKPTEEEPTPVQQGLIDQAIAALNAAVEQTGEDMRNAAGSALAAQDAQAAAEAAQSAAEAAERLAAGSAGEAAASAQAAAVSASEAEGYADTAAGLASEAANSASDAERSAERAEQAATSAGYLDVEIDANGHLIYTRTDAVDVDFELVNGHLIMEVV